MSDILYRPNLDYEKSYKSDGAFDKDTASSPSGTATTPVDSRSIEGMQSTLDRLNAILPSVPADIAKALSEPLKAAQYMLNQLSPTYYDPDYVNTTSTVVYTPPTPSGDTPSGSTPDEGTGDENTTGDTGNKGITFPSSVFSDVDIWTVTVQKDDPINKIEKDYNKIVGSILHDYLTNMTQSLAKYTSNIVVATAGAGLNSVAFAMKKYETKTSSLKDKNLMHLSDVVVRSALVRDQKIKLFKKLFNEKETITHLKACKVAKELKQRYYDEKTSPNKDYLDLAKNSMLSSSKLVYDKKYKENLFNLYKYMNSSVILINESLNLFMEEAQAKAILIKEGGLKS